MVEKNKQVDNSDYFKKSEEESNINYSPYNYATHFKNSIPEVVSNFNNDEGSTQYKNNNYYSANPNENESTLNLKANFEKRYMRNSDEKVEKMESIKKVRSVSKKFTRKTKKSMTRKISGTENVREKLSEFLKQFKKFEKVVISQIVDYAVFYSSSLSCIRYIFDGYSPNGNMYRFARAKDVSDFTMRNCIR